MPPSNSKKRKYSTLSSSQSPAPIFDPAARQEYLSGFHKRKLARIAVARQTAEKIAKEEKNQARRNIRQQRKEELVAHVQAVEAGVQRLRDGEIESEDEEGEEWLGVDGTDGGEGEIEGGADKENVERREEDFVDEDKYTTVTVEAMGGSDEGEEENSRKADGDVVGGGGGDGKVGGRAGGKRNEAADGKPKLKKHKFRYESKAERSATRQHLKARNQKAKARREDSGGGDGKKTQPNKTQKKKKKKV